MLKSRSNCRAAIIYLLIVSQRSMLYWWDGGCMVTISSLDKLIKDHEFESSNFPPWQTSINILLQQ